MACQRQTRRRPSLGGLEPPSFRLTAERASQLRHRDPVFTQVGPESGRKRWETSGKKKKEEIKKKKEQYNIKE